MFPFEKPAGGQVAIFAFSKCIQFFYTNAVFTATATFSPAAIPISLGSV